MTVLAIRKYSTKCLYGHTLNDLISPLFIINKLALHVLIAMCGGIKEIKLKLQEPSFILFTVGFILTPHHCFWTHQTRDVYFLNILQTSYSETVWICLGGENYQNLSHCTNKILLS